MSDKRSATLTTRVELEFAGKVSAAAERSDRSVSDYVRLVLRDHLENGKPANVAAERPEVGA